MSNRPTEDTHGLSINGFYGHPWAVDLRGLPFGLPATHDPQNAVARIPADVVVGPAGTPFGQPSSVYLEDLIELELEWVTAAQFTAYRDFVAQYRVTTLAERRIRYSPLGMTDYLDDNWTLLSTTAGWREVTPNRYAGPILLMKQGEAF